MRSCDTASRVVSCVWPIKPRADNPVNQLQVKTNTCRILKTRENLCKQVPFWLFQLQAYFFLARHKLRSNSEQRKRRNPADSQLKTAPSGTPSPYLIVVSLYSRLSLWSDFPFVRAGVLALYIPGGNIMLEDVHVNLSALIGFFSRFWPGQISVEL